MLVKSYQNSQGRGSRDQAHWKGDHHPSISRKWTFPTVSWACAAALTLFTKTILTGSTNGEKEKER